MLINKKANIEHNNSRSSKKNYRKKILKSLRQVLLKVVVFTFKVHHCFVVYSIAKQKQ